MQVSTIEESTDAATPATADATWSGWYALIVLVVATLFSIADRYIFSLLAEPIRLALGLSDLQIGLLQGFGLALFAAIVSYPIGWLADRYDRRLILAGCVLVWSLGVAACGFAQTFPQLIVASAIVGGGEAGLIPIVFGLIPEIFRRRKRILANALFATSTKLGASLGVAFCGWLVFAVGHYRSALPDGIRAIEDWRLAFFGAALPAVVMIPLILSIRIPRRTVRRGDTAIPSGRLAPYLRAEGATLVPFLLGMGIITFGFLAATSWVPMILMRSFHASGSEVGAGLAVSNFAGSVVGFVVSVYGLRRFGARLGPLLPMRIIWLSALAGAGTSLLLLLVRDSFGIYLVQGAQVAFTMAAFMVYPTAIQDLAPATLRSRVASLSYLSSVVLGASSPVVVGALSDALKARPDGLLVATVGVAVVSLVGAAVLLRFAERTYLRTLETARALDATARVEAR